MFLNFCFMLLVIFSKYSLKKHISLFMLSKNLFEIFMHLISILAFLSLIYLYGANFEFSFDLAYDRRFNSREVVQAGSSIAYFLSFYGGALIPISAVYGIIYKKPMLQLIFLSLLSHTTTSIFSLTYFSIDDIKMLKYLCLFLVGTRTEMIIS